MKKSVFGFSVRDIAEIAILVALALGLDKLKISVGATGGSVNFAMFPLFVIALRHGPFKGFIAGGIVYGLISCLLDEYGMQFYAFDYLIPFGAPALLGFIAKYVDSHYDTQFNKENALGIVLSYVFIAVGIMAVGFIRILSSSINSVLFYEYTYAAGLTYNLSYCLPSAIGSMIIVLLLLPTIVLLNKRFRTTFLSYKKEAK